MDESDPLRHARQRVKDRVRDRGELTAFAALAAVNKGQLSSFANGKGRSFSPTMLEKIAKAMDLDFIGLLSAPSYPDTPGVYKGSTTGGALDQATARAFLDREDRYRKTIAKLRQITTSLINTVAEAEIIAQSKSGTTGGPAAGSGGGGRKPRR